MNITGESYSIGYDNRVIEISGKLSNMPEGYGSIEAFFKKIIESEPPELTLDIRNLEYLNSSGIKALCIGLILEAETKQSLCLNIRCSKRHGWQRETVPSFKDLIDNLNIVFED
ncbi:MAG: hypothetical protein BWK80_21045 [Desulfobacteraceae bacterium IS3]|nr:MAG: hypothetical protein BWK80_21045 [Desulfobacteraceae bacterium IS3]